MCTQNLNGQMPKIPSQEIIEELFDNTDITEINEFLFTSFEHHIQVLIEHDELPNNVTDLIAMNRYLRNFFHKLEKVKFK